MYENEADTYTVYWRQICNLPVLSKEETFRLIALAQNGDKTALNRVVECNLRLVVSIARKFRYTKMPFADLVSEGNFGLFDAVKKFDLSKDLSFSTYATFQIVNRIQMAVLTQNSMIRIPGNVQRDLSRIEKAQSELIKDNYCEQIRLSDLAEKTGYSLGDLQKLMLLNFEAVKPLHSTKDNNAEAVSDSDQIIEIVLEDNSYAPEPMKENEEIFSAIEKWFSTLKQTKQTALLSSVSSTLQQHNSNVAFYQSSLSIHDQNTLLHSLRNCLFEKTSLAH